MKLDPQQLARFEEEGYLFIPSVFSPPEVAVLKSAADEVYAMDREEVWRESDSIQARAATGAPVGSYTFHGLTVFNPAASNGSVSRVATSMPLAAAVAAM